MEEEEDDEGKNQRESQARVGLCRRKIAEGQGVHGGN